MPRLACWSNGTRHWKISLFTVAMIGLVLHGCFHNTAWMEDFLLTSPTLDYTSYRHSHS